MAEKRDSSADHLTFSQRHGLEPLPQPMQLEELSDDLRREIWNLVYRFFKRFYYVSDSMGLLGRSGLDVDGEIQGLIVKIFGKLYKLPRDEISSSFEYVMQLHFKKTIMHEKFNKVLDFIEIVANHPCRSYRLSNPKAQLIDTIQHQFEQHAAAYWLDASQRPYKFFPRASKEQGEATQQAIETLNEAGMGGAVTHLRDASGHIRLKQYADSIADSIHAVESVACVIAQKANATLGQALDSLEEAKLLKHSALKKAFKNLYGYTSDEQGIRHALLDKNSPDVGLDEAVFMFGACASFAAYLVKKHRQMQKP